MKQVILFITALSLTSCATIRVSSDYDTDVNFNSYTTYAFFKPGIDKVEISDLDKRRVLRALESSLVSKGFSASETPNVLISFHTKAEKNVRISENYIGWGGPFYGPFGGWGWGFNRPYNINTSTTGVLYIDIIDATTKKLVWQGKGTGSLGKGSPQEREERIREFVAEILTAYPPQSM